MFAKQVLFFFGLLLMVTTGAAFFVDWGERHFVVDARQETFTATVGPVKEGHQNGQTFVSGYNGLSKVEVLVATYGRRLTAPLVFHLRSSRNSKKDIRTIKKRAVLRDNEYYGFSFDRIPDSEGKSYYFFIEFKPETERTFTLWRSKRDLYPEGVRAKRGSKARGDLCFRTFAQADVGSVTANFGREILRSRVVLASTVLYATVFMFLWFAIGRVGSERRG